jgi:hypothetical protein
MKFRHLALAAALILGTATGVSAKDNWLGAWGFVPTPPPPGMTPLPAPVSTAPLSVVTNLPAPIAPSAPLLDNPGNVPVVIPMPIRPMSPCASWCAWRWPVTVSACASPTKRAPMCWVLGAVHYRRRRPRWQRGRGHRSDRNF